MEVSEVETTSEQHLKHEIDATSLMDYCRLCMAHNLNMICIFEAEKETIVADIQFCTGITINQEAGLPTKICEGCLNNLSVAYKFKTSCLTADEIFRKIATTPHIKAEEELSDVEYDKITVFKNESGEFREYVTKEQETVKEKICKLKKSSVKVKNRSSLKGRPRKKDGSLKQPRRLRKFKFKRLCCEPCNMKFDTKEESDKHKQETHSNNWVCEICGKLFMHRASHYTHIRSHLPPNYECDHCGYKTWHKYDLAKHIRTHSGIKMYQCEYCTSSYYTSSNLHSHIRRLHNNEKTHDCNLCRRTFFDRTKLKRHLDSHNEIKRFKCDVCQSSFTRRCYLKKHLLRQHDIVTPAQRPGRQKTNIVIGDYPTTKDEINEKWVDIKMFFQ